MREGEGHRHSTQRMTGPLDIKVEMSASGGSMNLELRRSEAMPPQPLMFLSFIAFPMVY